MPTNREIQYLIKVRDEASQTFGQLKVRVKDLRNELNNVEVGSKRFKELGAQIRETDSEVQRIRNSTKSVSQIWKDNWLAVTGAVGAALIAVKQGFDLAKEAAKAQQTMAAFDATMQQLGKNGERVFADLNKAAGGIIDDSDLAQLATNAANLGIPVEKLSGLMRIARATARDFGISASEAFQKITEAIGRGQPRQLVALGLIGKMESTTGKLAETIGEASDQMASQEQQLALLNQVFDKGAEKVAKYNLEQLTSIERIQKLEATVQNIKEFFGGLLIRAGALFVGIANNILQVFQAGATGVFGLSAAVEIALNKLGVSDSKYFQNLTSQSVKTYNQLGKNALDAYGALIASDKDLAGSSNAVTQALDNQSKSSEKAAGTLKSYSDAVEKAKKALDGLQPGTRAYIEQLLKVQTAQAHLDEATGRSAVIAIESGRAVKLLADQHGNLEATLKLLGATNEDYALQLLITTRIEKDLTTTGETLNAMLERYKIKGADAAATTDKQSKALKEFQERMNKLPRELPLVQIGADVSSLEYQRQTVQRLEEELSKLPIEGEAWRKKLQELAHERAILSQTEQVVSLKLQWNELIASWGNIDIRKLEFLTSFTQSFEQGIEASLKAIVNFTRAHEQVDIAAMRKKAARDLQDLTRRNRLADIEANKERVRLAEQLKNGEISREEYNLRIQDLDAQTVARREELETASAESRKAIEEAWANNQRSILDDLSDVWAKFWEDVVNQALAELARLAAAKILGGIFSIFGGLFHEGGTVGSPSGAGAGFTPTPVNFAHEGLKIPTFARTRPGLKAGEVPIIAQVGETIRTVKQEKEVQKIVREARQVLKFVQERDVLKSVVLSGSDRMNRFHEGGTVGRAMPEYPSNYIQPSGRAFATPLPDASSRLSKVHQAPTVNNIQEVHINISVKGDAIKPDTVKKAVEQGMRAAGIRDARRYFLNNRDKQVIPGYNETDRNINL